MAKQTRSSRCNISSSALLLAFTCGGLFGAGPTVTAIELTQTVQQPLEQPFVRIYFRNDASVPLKQTLDRALATIEWAVEKEDGSSRFTPMWQEAPDSSSLGRILSIAAAGSTTVTVPVGSARDFGGPGNVFLSLRQIGSGRVFRFQITVAERQAAAMQQRCQQLLRAATRKSYGPEDVLEAEQAAAALLAIKDIEAVPFIAQLASHDVGYSYSAAQSLADLGGDQAAAEILRLFRATKNKDRWAFFIGPLEGVSSKLGKSQLRDELSQALELAKTTGRN